MKVAKTLLLYGLFVACGGNNNPFNKLSNDSNSNQVIFNFDDDNIDCQIFKNNTIKVYRTKHVRTYGTLVNTCGKEAIDSTISNWDVSSVENMNYMFNEEEFFNQPLNKWDVSNVKFMNGMFFGAYSFNQPLNNWNVSNVIEMGYMFAKAGQFNQPLDKWDVRKVKTMNNMFDRAHNFVQSLNKWEVGTATEVCQMFSFTMPELPNWYLRNKTSCN